ncbi:MAG: phage terminase large subunit [Clostridiales bacterium]|jgi:PBSX family phage terminase large subunit|nr:phage terminase large subunit [Clostridiales bacterium]
MAGRNGTPNLLPVRTKEEAKKRGSAGGKKSGEARRAKKAEKIRLKQILELSVDKDILQSPNILGNDAKQLEGDADYKTMLDIALVRKAGQGNIEAIKYINDLVNDDKAKTPIWRGLPAIVIARDFSDVYRDIKAGNHREYDFEGGRGTTKSSVCGFVIIDDIESNPDGCWLCMRQVGNTMKDSIYAQIVWCITELGLAHDYHTIQSPMEITKKSTGQVIYFRGADDPGKMKSIKTPNGKYMRGMWLEEKDQFRGSAAIRKIRQSAMRGGDSFLELGSYNTPRSAHHFINKEKLTPKSKKLIHKSCYLNVPKEWLGEPFFEEAEHLKATNELAYRHEYLGEAVGIGDNVFDNIITRPITDAEIKRFDTCYYGQDWGWYPDPNHFAGCYYHSGSRKLYIYEEIRANKCSNEDWAKRIAHHKNDRITGDSAEQKSINDFRSWDFDMRGAIKGPGSIDYSMKWLQSLTEIIIDPVRCPKTAEEFTLYEYEKDKDDNVISGYPDKDNHSLDAVRYSLESIWKRRGQ